MQLKANNTIRLKNGDANAKTKHIDAHAGDIFEIDEATGNELVNCGAASHPNSADLLRDPEAAQHVADLAAKAAKAAK